MPTRKKISDRQHLANKKWFRKEAVLNFSLVPENTQFLSDLHYEDPKQ
jgi:hypothetical protein